MSYVNVITLLSPAFEYSSVQVVDISSTWKAFSPKLCCDTRPLVLKATAELLALVPALNIKTEEYEARDQPITVSDC